MAGAVMVQAAAAHSGYALRAAADPHPAPREAFARDFNASAYADMKELCADKAVEVIYIATPHQFHAPHAIMAAEHGKHVILEKPMALTLADCDAIIAAVERNKVQLIVGHTHAFDPEVRAMRGMIASGELGRLGMINSSTTRLISIARGGRRSSTPRKAAASCSTRCRTRSTPCACSAAAW